MKQTANSRKVNEVARESIAQILLIEISDPRLTFVTVTGVEVSKDRSVAQVFVSTQTARYAEVEAGLQSARGRIRSLLGQKLGWRVTPELRFIIDTSVDQAERIQDALKASPATLLIPKDEDGNPL
ncbi:MAG: 30S ribosome-binding factor RbfA [Coriobacteriales bacterium]|jgi:ribosome-binding factor A|nr:30S ribosome-binding factor RbfA [Coriobacteriales bacterium]